MYQNRKSILRTKRIDTVSGCQRVLYTRWPKKLTATGSVSSEGLLVLGRLTVSSVRRAQASVPTSSSSSTTSRIQMNRRTEHTSVPGCERMNQFSKKGTGRILTAPVVEEGISRVNSQIQIQYPPAQFRTLTHPPKVYAIEEISFNGQVNLDRQIRIGADFWIVNLLSRGERFLDVIITPPTLVKRKRPTIIIDLTVWTKNSRIRNEENLRIEPSDPNCRMELGKPNGTDTLFMSIGVHVICEL